MRYIQLPPSRRCFVTLCGWALVASIAWPVASLAEGLALTLESTRTLAASRAPGVEAQSARVVAAREDALRADALPDPLLQVGIDNLTVTGADAFRIGADDMTMRRIGLMQEWPSRRKRQARLAAAEGQASIALSEAAVVRLAVERSAGEAWIEAWAAEEEVKFLQLLIIDADRATRIAAAQLANGTGTASEALGAQSARVELEVEQRAAQARARSARAGLSRWLGEVEAQAPLQQAFDALQLSIDAARHRAALEQHAGVSLWEERERLADAAVQLARAEKRPDLAFAVSYGARSAGLPDMAMFEVSVGLPLFARGRQDRDIAARVAELDAARAEREDARRMHAEDLERELARWEGLRAERELYRDSLLPLARDRAAIALAAFGGGESIQPWLDARRDEIATRRRDVQTQAELARAWLRLDTLLPRDTGREDLP